MCVYKYECCGLVNGEILEGFKYSCNGIWFVFGIIIFGVVGKILW